MMSHERAARTVSAYRHGWARFCNWCSAAGRDPLPASSETLCLYVAACIDEGLRLASVRLYLSAIRHVHVQGKFECPVGRDSEVRRLMDGAARALRERPAGRAPLTPAQVRSMSVWLVRSRSPMAARDRAVIVLGFALGWRGSELSSLDLSDVSFTDRGLRVRLGASKTDQQGKGREAAIPYGRRAVTCPVRVLRAWIDVRGRWPGPLFPAARANRSIGTGRLSCDAVCAIVKRTLDAIGEDASSFGSHSLRAGMATSGAENGASEIAIMQRGGWKNIHTVLRYVRPAQAFRADPLAGVL